MKKYPFLEAIGTVDEKFLEEALNDSKEQERRQISMNKRNGNNSDSRGADICNGGNCGSRWNQQDKHTWELF